MGQILAIRAQVEELVVDEESLAFLGEIGQRTSLRFGFLIGCFPMLFFLMLLTLFAYQACSSAVITCQHCCKNEWPRQHLQGNYEIGPFDVQHLKKCLLCAYPQLNESLL